MPNVPALNDHKVLRWHEHVTSWNADHRQHCYYSLALRSHLREVKAHRHAVQHAECPDGTYSSVLAQTCPNLGHGPWTALPQQFPHCDPIPPGYSTLPRITLSTPGQIIQVCVDPGVSHSRTQCTDSTTTVPSWCDHTSPG